jgi:hypothetical protein
MARARMLARSLSTSQRYANLHDIAGKLAEFCQALYPLLVAHADDFGRQAGDVFTVKHAVCPTSPRRLEDVERALAALHQVNLIAWYEVDGRKCIEIVDFARYQVGLHKRTKSHFPEPAGDSGKFPEIPSEEKRTEEKRTEEKRTGDSPVVVAVDTQDPQQPDAKLEAFVKLWNETVTAPIAQCRGLSETRKKHLRARLKERPFSEWLDIIKRIQASPFCRGEIPPVPPRTESFVATFDWLVDSPNTALKVLEGRYDERRKVPRPGGGPVIPDAEETRRRYLS